ncbi:hypothetical protein NS355_17655 [Sphingomonas yabuuchiae]|uniref:Uncharacterized protein n=1 Tax=Sphingomonas yabuuchiae TaxID=172044 RepID=A0A147IJE3_9SPHN|nr:hypothetical protein NS355_17655 [Sphingomonas yabuuchiae]
MHCGITRFAIIKAGRIGCVDRIAADIIVPVYPIGISDRIGLHEATERRRIYTRLIIVHAEFRQPFLPGILEAPLIGAAGDTEFIITVDRNHRPIGVRHRDD